MDDRESALQAKRIGRWLMKWGLILFACGAVTVLLGLATAGFGTRSYYSWQHFAILGGVAVLLYLGFLPTLVGAVLWIAGRVNEKKLNSQIKSR